MDKFLTKSVTEVTCLHLMDTVNAKKRWTTIYWRVNKFLKESHIVTRFVKELVIFED
jgi:hypothetical protein